MAKNMSIIGLTGGLGSGKSTVARQFALLGCAVIDADALNHEVLARPEIIQQIQHCWGPEVLDPDGQVDREALGRIVFQEKTELDKLMALVHPLIFEREKQLLEAYKRDPAVVGVVLDVPLLFEVGQDKWCDCVVFVDAEESLRYERLRRNRGLEAEKARKIEKKQMALDMKAKMSDHVIRNNSSIPELSRQVEEFFSLLKTK